MKLIIDIPEEVLKTRYYTDYFGCGSHKLTETLDNATPIPDNATNGEVLKTLFKPNRITRTADIVREEYEFNEVWWNALYQKGGKE